MATAELITTNDTGGGSMLRTVLVESLLPNPFRRLDEYPIQRSKVDLLRESIRSTGFWGTIVARPMGRRFEIAFGHHRMTALQEELGPRAKVEIIVRDLSNEKMLQMMARENLMEWSTSAWVELETLRSVIDAYGRDLIALPPVSKDTRKDLVRYVYQEPDTRSYTKGTVAEFLGWTRQHGNRVMPNNAAEGAFKALDMIDRGLLDESKLRGLSREQMRALVDGQWKIFRASEKQAEESRQAAAKAEKEAKQAATEAERAQKAKAAAVHQEQAEVASQSAQRGAKRFGDEAAAAMQSGEGVRAVQRMADTATAVGSNGKVYRIDDIARRAAKAIGKIADTGSTIAKDVAIIRQHRGDLSPTAAELIGGSITGLIHRLEKIRKSLKV